MQRQVLTAIRLGLDEIRRLDVLVAYSNIIVLDILNACLGGHPIRDQEFTIGGKPLLEIAYGWQNIQGLIEA